MAILYSWRNSQKRALYRDFFCLKLVGCFDSGIIKKEEILTGLSTHAVCADDTLNNGFLNY